MSQRVIFFGLIKRMNRALVHAAPSELDAPLLNSLFMVTFGEPDSDDLRRSIVASYKHFSG